MWEIIITELTQALQELARGFAHYLPRLIVMLIIALVGWVIAYLLKVLVRSILRLTKFSKLSENAGATQLLNQEQVGLARREARERGAEAVQEMPVHHTRQPRASQFIGAW